ncbi:2-oxo-4-hydroxy-4-carboxy-5-ureidoimidazoline decarboxylase [Gordonia sp. SID5947]|uniref:2-oxo-4-hydroxy-4-carboxy-5-ureidoimidazoline decarboxylase n=1 Tax=Gordonia sp. SID5947 TaxID=2690315 RepID=UPI00136A23EB|nr:2-oxo-4-hydroxy-4-carboxy-5-ureidoimidazoline decarboxylase [Gordonia sp. SID5947]MYR06167.1 2-oxo-4-hydroxy-4-carboxy-5-ureidoimidazoline decarboxylase [Gordonia sp. SID5947]
MRRVDWRGLASFNQLSERQAIQQLYECCSSSIWASRVADARPFPDDEALLEYADLILADLTDADLDEALAGHPRIGDRPDNPSSEREQSGVAGADASVLADLEKFNTAYEEKFGHVYLVFADGRPADELLDILGRRMHNDAETERRELRTELAKINLSRLTRMLTPASSHLDEGATT